MSSDGEPETKRACVEGTAGAAAEPSAPAAPSIRLHVEVQMEDAGNDDTFVLEGKAAEDAIRALTNKHDGPLEDAIALLKDRVNREEVLEISGELFRDLCSDSAEAADGATEMLFENLLAHTEGRFCRTLLSSHRRVNFADLAPMRTIVVRLTPPWA
jgi:hypothetical protein